MENNPSLAPSPERLAGIEWMRGLAAFGVICIHSGLAVHNRTTPASATLRECFDFAVPFFLITSFFFAIRDEKTRVLTWIDWLKRRGRRLLVPFVFWSAIYLSLHIGKLLAHHQAGQIKTLFADPAALVLSGGTSVALYFLPLLFIGLGLVHLLSGLFKRSPSWGLMAGFLITLAIREFFFRDEAYRTGARDLATDVLNFIIALIQGGVRCLPLVMAAALLERFLPLPRIRNAYSFLGIGLLLCLIVSIFVPPIGSTEMILGVGAFFVGWGLSGMVAPGPVAMAVGLFSFGVYLVHQLFLEVIQLAFSFHEPVGVMGTLCITVVVYAVSMGAVGMANRAGHGARSVFGLK